MLNLAWKNIFRNRVRSGVILTAIALGLFAGVYLSAFMSGWVLGSVNSDVEAHLAHIQVHNPDFLANGDINAFFERGEVESRIASSSFAPEIKASYRLKINGMLASASNAVGISAKCVFPDEERRVSTVWQQIPDSLGSFLPDDAKMPIVISRKTAEKLNVRLKSKIVFTFADAAGDMQSLAFRVSGIYKTTNTMLDEAEVFVRYSDIFPATGLPEGAAHEAAIVLKDLKTCDLFSPQITQTLNGFDVEDWKQISPVLDMSKQWVDMMAVIIIGIFLLALSFGIVNTMLMAVLERTRELGMLRAIGMGKSGIFRLLMLETLLLTGLGSVIGIVAGALLVIPSLKTGIDLTFLMSDNFEDYGYGSVIYPVLNLKMFVQIAVMVVIAGILSAVYPAQKALNIKVLDAIRGN